ncbi:MAG: hypothetical protein GEU96_10870 [Propionibacteriales bacterium]|nr:hypothetical protein [Propionibacteriales bacterium]
MNGIAAPAPGWVESSRRQHRAGWRTHAKGRSSGVRHDRRVRGRTERRAGLLRRDSRRRRGQPRPAAFRPDHRHHPPRSRDVPRFVTFWPMATTATQPIADAMNATPKVVFSRTLQRDPWEETRVVATSAAEEVARLRQQPGMDIVVWRSLSLAQSLMRGHLVDEYRLLVCPVALGTGRPVFPADLSLHEMTLVDSLVYECGVLSLTYQPTAR